MTRPQSVRRDVLYILFAISGFSGLIYESIWSHYLKLFLGHAAYAQTLVLAIFMGGMAIGAWLTSRYTVRWKNLLLAYAIIEGVIGVFALVFHNVFVVTTEFAYTSVIPNFVSPSSVNVFKWLLAGALILPQSILLGATFPLMSAGLIRRFPQNPGASVAMLYFTNSLGAAIGVLVSGFVLIDAVGLPGTLLTGGLVNVLLALVVWSLVRGTSEKAIAIPARRTDDSDTGLSRLLLGASFLTGAASFMYEIGWIRMLNLVLGTSTHAFELMLSAFILGLAFGGLWIRRRIDGLKQPILFLAIVQVTMGLLALATLVAYNSSFDLMRVIMDSLARTSNGYRLFNIASHAIALGIMLPATFCAGMTLPLITHVLMRQRLGEKSIGATYAANTLGAIVGVFFAIHVGLPVTGIKGLLLIGAALDMALAVVLVRVALDRVSWRMPAAAATIAATALIAVTFGVELDRYKMASGVYRTGGLYGPASAEVLFHKDGKTATVDLLKHSDGTVSIHTNGKPDASLNVTANKVATGDESTMTMFATIPLALHPRARTVANIGLGSGLSTHVLLGAPNIERVDTIEIEPAMIEGAQGFGTRVERTFQDARSHIYIDDAKTFFAAHRSRYDIIMSEPSNPWVSGVAGLFSDEFYRRVRTYLNPGGLFVQWLQLYEIDPGLVASVIKAMNRNFMDYAIYFANDGDIIVVARANGRLILPDFESVLAHPRLAEEMRKVNVVTVQDLTLRYLGDRMLLEPLFATFDVPPNSDFFPVLDLNAVRARFMRRDAGELFSLRAEPLPVLEMLGSISSRVDKTQVTLNPKFALTRFVRAATQVRDVYLNGTLAPLQETTLDANLARHLVAIQQFARDCHDRLAPALWFDSVFHIASITFQNLSPQENALLSRRWRASDCYARLSAAEKEALALFQAVGQRDGTSMARIAERLLSANVEPNREQSTYLLGAGMLGYLAQNRPADALRLWSGHRSQVQTNDKPLSFMFRLLLAHSIRPDMKKETGEVVANKGS